VKLFLFLVPFLISIFFPPSLVHLFSLFLTNSKNRAELTVVESGGKKNEMRERDEEQEKQSDFF